MAGDVQAQIDKSYLSSSNIAIDKIDIITINYDKYNPTGAGSYIELPEWASSKKPALILKTKIRNVSNIVFNALFLKYMRKTILNE